MRFFAWLGITVTAGAVAWLMTMGVVLAIETGHHQRASFFVAGHGEANGWWMAVPVIVTAATALISGAVLGKRDD